MIVEEEPEDTVPYAWEGTRSIESMSDESVFERQEVDKSGGISSVSC